MTDSERIAELEKLVEFEQNRANDLANKLNALKLIVQKNCGHWYEPGYGLKTWIPDKWVTAALGYKPKSHEII
jgi:hypothetical protein